MQKGLVLKISYSQIASCMGLGNPMMILCLQYTIYSFMEEIVNRRSHCAMRRRTDVTEGGRKPLHGL